MFSMNIDDTVKRFPEFLELDDVMSFLTFDELYSSIKRIDFNNQLATKLISKVFNECTRTEKIMLLDIMKLSPDNDYISNFNLFELILTSLEIPILTTLFRSIKTLFNDKKQEPQEQIPVKSKKLSIQTDIPSGHAHIIETQFLTKLKEGDETGVRQILGTYPDINLYCETNDFFNPMMVACASGNLNIVKLLYNHGCDINKTSSKGLFPLQAAIQNDQLEVVKFLFSVNVIIPKTDQRDITEIAAIFSSVNCIKYLLDEIHINFNAHLYYTAACYSNIEFLNFLYDRFSYMQQINVALALAAASTGNNDALNFFYDSKGVDIDAIDLRGRTSLMYAIKENRIKTAKLLVDKGCNVNIRTFKNKDALHYTVKKGDVKFFEYLITHGATIDDLNKLISVAERCNNTEMKAFLRANNY
ncbi:hypothetical protein TVAG_337620 [Trichomonas vaginalis G3]|uniref:Uncharacterized protein n=1 Tax=Trichomonas vaginalis (strain ATCC PRA-98 / G3) TaxID=412133 RepID=A2EWK8_TRIV3|nr:protein ubiquitination [Trichomonas vaginalis G3]EAY02962.1 hypothetical protein TVAG_337620 [Trichomonas vaginalis G3]KAI5492197.1 protein ubiquitination [Trichomonas vaginalis G3]|eukprot:XP_001315185.1 hypothetical protein [Trichomonas vaginalis G3]